MTSGSGLDRNRPTQQTDRPRESAADPNQEVTITNREADFAEWVQRDLARRQEAEGPFHHATELGQPGFWPRTPEAPDGSDGESGRRYLDR